jgi:hypothetical protein
MRTNFGGAASKPRPFFASAIKNRRLSACALYPGAEFLLKGGMTNFARSFSRRIIGPVRA